MTDEVTSTTSNLITKYPRKWEKMDQTCYRLRVPHGWLVALSGDKERSVVYVPDDKEEWILKKN